MFVCFVHRLFTPLSTPKGVDFCMHDCFYSCVKGSHAPSLGKFDMHAENLLYKIRRESMEGEKKGVGNVSFRWWRKPKCPERTTG